MANFMKKVLTIQLLTLATLSGVGIYACHSVMPKTAAQDNSNRFDGVKEYMITTPDGEPVTLPQSGNPIPIVLNGFNEVDREKAKAAILELDNILDSVDYTILDTDNISITQKIVINNNTPVEGPGLGYTSLDIDRGSAEICYPISIYIDPDCTKWHDENGNSALEYVIKHEMGHTLGFADIDDPSLYGQTIMYNTLSDVQTYTDLDIKNFKQVYDMYYLGNSETQAKNSPENVAKKSELLENGGMGME